MRKGVPCIDEPANALQKTPNARQGGEEAEETRVRRVAERRVGPVLGIEAEEYFDILESMMSMHMWLILDGGTYIHRVSLTAEHVTEKEVTELDWIETRQR